MPPVLGLGHAGLINECRALCFMDYKSMARDPEQLLLGSKVHLSKLEERPSASIFTISVGVEGPAKAALGSGQGAGGVTSLEHTVLSILSLGAALPHGGVGVSNAKPRVTASQSRAISAQEQEGVATQVAAFGPPQHIGNRTRSCPVFRGRESTPSAPPAKRQDVRRSPDFLRCNEVLVQTRVGPCSVPSVQWK